MPASGRAWPATLVIVLAGCGAAGAPLATQGPTTVATTGPDATQVRTPAPTPTLPAGVVRVIDLGEPTWGIVTAGSTVWVEGEMQLHQLDGASGAVLQTIAGWWPTVREDTLWYLRDDDLVEADAVTGAERAAYRPGVLGTTVHDGVLWADDEAAGKLLAVDLESGEVLHALDLPPGEAKWVEFWEGAIWTVVDGSNVVVRVDPDTGRTLGSSPAGSRPHSVAIGFGSLWVTDHGSADLQRFAPDGTLQATIHGPGINVGIAAAADSLWVAAPAGVMEIDPATNEVVREIELGPGDWYGMTVSQGFVWLTSADRGRLYQIAMD